MATASLLALVDDIASVLDDVALLTKVATKKTAGVLGDDLALNAQQVTGVKADRELPVVWAVAKGSFRNKAILVPAALAISAFAPWLVTPLLMVGGCYLTFEASEKILEAFLPHEAGEDVEELALSSFTSTTTEPPSAWPPGVALKLEKTTSFLSRRLTIWPFATNWSAICAAWFRKPPVSQRRSITQRVFVGFWRSILSSSPDGPFGSMLAFTNWPIRT